MLLSSLNYSQTRNLVQRILGPLGRVWRRRDGQMRIEIGFEKGKQKLVVARGDTFLEAFAALDYVLKMDTARAKAVAESLEAHGCDPTPVLRGEVTDVETYLRAQLAKAGVSNEETNSIVDNVRAAADLGREERSILTQDARGDSTPTATPLKPRSSPVNENDILLLTENQ